MMTDCLVDMIHETDVGLLPSPIEIPALKAWGRAEQDAPAWRTPNAPEATEQAAIETDEDADIRLAA